MYMLSSMVVNIINKGTILLLDKIDLINNISF